MMIPVQEGRCIMLVIKLILSAGFWTKIKQISMILVIKISSRFLKRFLGRHQLIKINVEKSTFKRRVVVSDPCILCFWTINHRRVVSRELILGEILWYWWMVDEAMIKRLLLLFERVAPTWELHGRAIHAIVVAIAATDWIAGRRRHLFAGSYFHIWLLFWVNDSWPYFMSTSWHVGR